MSSFTALAWFVCIDDLYINFTDRNLRALKCFHCKASSARKAACQTDRFPIVHSARLIGQRHTFGHSIQYHMCGPADGFWCSQNLTLQCLHVTCMRLHAGPAFRVFCTNVFHTETNQSVRSLMIRLTHKARMQTCRTTNYVYLRQRWRSQRSVSDLLAGREFACLEIFGSF